MTRLDRYWSLARELVVSLNLVYVLADYGLIEDNGVQARLVRGMSFEEAMKQARVLRTLCGDLHTGLRKTGAPQLDGRGAVAGLIYASNEADLVP